MSGFAAHFLNRFDGEEKMKKIIIKAYAKINLSLDVLGTLDNGYHQVEMVMQQILLHDIVQIRWFDRAEINMGKSGSLRGTAAWKDTAGLKGKKRQQYPAGRIEIFLSTNRPYLPVDQRNLAYQAAVLMAEHYGEGRSGIVRIDIKKKIPVAAGMAGGSSNGAAVIHGLNRLWNLNLSMTRLCELGSRLGSDVPFSIMGQAKMNRELGLYKDPLACHCAVARGTGTDMEPIRGLKSHLVLAKPPIGVSTAEVYRGIDSVEIREHPNTEELIRALAGKENDLIKKNMVNVLENFTLTRYPNVMYTKNNLKKLFPEGTVLMSGSGPTIFALCQTKEEAQEAYQIMYQSYKESFWTRTTY